uniref:Uncharacterized protein n=1 Tax=Setaria digitata TaxID=48799 RepID=A0A915Q7A8_9BILA
MSGVPLLLFSLTTVCAGELEDRFLEGCNSHCTAKFDENLLCWNKTAQFFGKALMGVILRYVTTQKSIDRMVKHMGRYNVDNNVHLLTRQIINETVTSFVSASFKTIKTSKQPSLLSCPEGCERSSTFWLSWSFISLLLSGVLTAAILMKTFEKDRIDQNYSVAEETTGTNKHKKG